MTILQLDNISLDFGDSFLLDNVSLKVDEKETIFLVGRNGAGKSSFLKIINKTLTPDTGQIWYADKLKVAMLSQELPKADDKTIFEVVAKGLDKIGDLLEEYYKLTNSKTNDDTWLKKLESVQKQIEVLNGWQYEQKIKTILTKLNLNSDTLMSNLSGGWRRRVTLAQVFVAEPDLLLLDEPTNHLDLENIVWMEKQLAQYNGTIICISHDRAFVDKLAKRIIEIDRGKLYSYVGNLKNYLAKKEKRLIDEANANKLFDKKLAEEEVWIRQGIKARRTRNEGRVRALKALRVEHQNRRSLLEKPSFDFSNSNLSSKLIVDAENISYSYDEKNVIKNFSTKIFRGDKIGIIGPNGCGKSTLIKLLLGKLVPSTGKVQLGVNLDVAYYDQLRTELDKELSVIDNVAAGRTTIEINGKQKHIISYLGDFLFTPEKARTFVTRLSGGECNRVLLAKLFSNPANVLVLDEPTNDLDVETLELLEEILSNYDGTVILVSHDRFFMDNVVSEIYAFEEDGTIVQNVGGYSDWLEYKNNTVKAELKNIKTVDKKDKKENKSKKLSYNLQRELDSLPKKIENLENEISLLQNKMAETDFYRKDEKEIAKTMNALKDCESELEKSYARWEELDSM